jgi:hypothetical protein
MEFVLCNSYVSRFNVASTKGLIMFQVFSRSWQGLNLSPGERAAMKLVGGVLFTGVGAGALVAIQLIATGNHDFQYIGIAAGGAAAKTLWDTVGKYKSAQTDLPLPAPSLAGPPVEMPAQAVQVPAPTPRFTTPVPQPQSFIPMPQAGGAYVPPFDRNWSDMVPSVTSQTTLPQVPTP